MQIFVVQRRKYSHLKTFTLKLWAAKRPEDLVVINKSVNIIKFKKRKNYFPQTQILKSLYLDNLIFET